MISAGSGPNAATINFDGGTFLSTAAGGTQIGAAVKANVRDGGAVFDVATGSVTVAANLTPAASGTGGLVKRGAGNLILTGVNTYSGGTTVETGILYVGSGKGALGTGGVTINAGARLSVSATDDVTVGNALGGAGDFEINSPGVTTLTARNAYTGSTFIKQGTVVVADFNALGDTAAVRLGFGVPAATLRYTGDGDTLAKPVVLGGTGDLVIEAAGGPLSVTGSVTQGIAGRQNPDPVRHRDRQHPRRDTRRRHRRHDGRPVAEQDRRRHVGLVGRQHVRRRHYGFAGHAAARRRRVRRHRRRRHDRRQRPARAEARHGLVAPQRRHRHRHGQPGGPRRRAAVRAEHLRRRHVRHRRPACGPTARGPCPARR